MIDPPGTCKHPPHRIGAPDTFAPYEQPSAPAKVLLEQADVAALLDAMAELLEAANTRHKHRDVLHRVSTALAVARNTC